MTDRYGVPDSTFGHVPEEFYGLMGRVVMMAAVLEDKLLVLAWALDIKPQEMLAGKRTDELFAFCRHRLAQRDDQLREAGVALLDRTREVFQQRHRLVHSLWPGPNLEAARGWRTLPRAQRQGGGHTFEWVATSEPELRSLIGTMAQLLAEHDQFRMRIPAPPVS